MTAGPDDGERHELVKKRLHTALCTRMAAQYEATYRPGGTPVGLGWSKKKWALWFVVVGFIVLAIAGHFTAPHATTITGNQFDAVRVGETQKQVRKELGHPKKSYTSKTTDVATGAVTKRRCLEQMLGLPDEPSDRGSRSSRRTGCPTRRAGGDEHTPVLAIPISAWY